MRRPPGHVLAALLVACAAGGCASVSDTAQQLSLEALGTEVPPPKHAKATTDCAPVRFASIAPTALPRSGAMRPQTHMARIYERGYLRVGVDQNSLGLGWFDPSAGEMRGLDPALAWEIVKAIFPNPDPERNIRHIAISTGQRASVIENEDVDLVASAYSITCERQKTMHFSSVYYRAQQKLLVLDGADVDDLADLAGEKVCATRGSTSLTRLRQAPSVTPYEVALRTDCLVALQEGQVAAVTSDDAILYGFQQQDPQTQIVGECLAVERYGLAMSKEHPEFVGFVNGVLARLERDEQLEHIRRRWLKGLEQPTRAQIDACEDR
jgi:polar amino acid transport system substrate-binding protein